MHSEFVEVSLSHDLAQSATNTLSDTIMFEAAAVLRHFMRECDAAGLPRNKIRGIATAVYRKAANGQDFLLSILEGSSVIVRIVEQEEEGNLGFASALTLLPSINPQQVLQPHIPVYCTLTHLAMYQLP